MGNRSKLAGAVVVGALALASTFLPSPAGVQQVQEFEGKRNTAYLDAVRVPTLCYGSTRGVQLGQTATDAECAEKLREDLTYAGRGVAQGVRVRLTQSQYDALVSLVFNIGETQFYKSTLLRDLNAGACYVAARQFDRWVYAKGTKLPGLVKRRTKERELFERDCHLWTE